MPYPPPAVKPEVVINDLTDRQLDAYLAVREIAIDTETLGLNPLRDRLCLVQLCDRDGRATLIRIARRADASTPAPRLKRLLESPKILKVFHFARFDLATLRHHLGIVVAPVYCTRTASKIARTYTERHGLKDLALDLLDVEMDKSMRNTDWSAPALIAAQIEYAAADVSMLLQLKDRLNAMLEREGRMDLALECFGVIPTIARLDLAGYRDVFEH
ncbi:MAG: ribonuclease D [Vicinamibacteria bacterium]|nr:ribonuclease D [Vicinamibacteria bacterium]